MLLPERTVDSLFAIEVVRQYPFAQIWSMQSQLLWSNDHTVRALGQLLGYFECKGINAAGEIEVRVDQLERYISGPYRDFPISYVLPVMSSPAPWDTYCARSCCDGPCTNARGTLGGGLT